jgi:CubicO group peptidase (beta-lactamase class C family)
MPLRPARSLVASIVAVTLSAAACEQAEPPRPPVCPPQPGIVPLAVPLPAASAEPAQAAEPAAPDPADKPPKVFDVDAVDRWIAHKVKQKGLVGLSVAVARDGKIVLAKGYGKVAAAGDAAVDADTAFAIGSISKQFTCAAALLLAEEGKLALKDKVARYYPDLTRAKDITLYDVLTHVSGYHDYYPLDFLDARMEKPTTPDDLIRTYAGKALDFEPGTRWSYSNTGFVIAGRVVEKVAREPLGAFLARRVFTPLGMAHTRLDPKQGTAGLATGHRAFAFGPLEPAPPEREGWLQGAAGIYASAADLARWGLGLVDGKVLKPKSFELMTAPRKLADGSVRGYACGLGVGPRQGETVLSHSGAVSGFLAYEAIIPRTRSAVIVLSNSESGRAEPIHGALLSLVLTAGGRPGVVIPTVAGPPAADVVTDLFRQMAAGAVDRARLGADFSAYLTDDRLREAAPRLRALGEPTEVEVDILTERGAMEVAVVKLVFKSTTLSAQLFRTPDGKVQELLFDED